MFFFLVCTNLASICGCLLRCEWYVPTFMTWNPWYFNWGSSALTTNHSYSFCNLRTYILLFGMGETSVVKSSHRIVVLNSTSHTRGKWCFLVSADLVIVCDCFSYYWWYASIFEMSDNPSATCGSQIPYKDVVIIILGVFIYFFIKSLFLPRQIKT